LAGKLEEIHAAGAELVFVGNGRPDQAAAFARREVPGVTVLTDPSREAYRALGLIRGILPTLGPGSVAAGVGAALRGHRQTALEGDAWQQGGLLLIDRGGRVLFLQRNRDAGDRPDLDGALAVLARGLGPASRRTGPVAVGRRARRSHG
jgi:hypothetical protein